MVTTLVRAWAVARAFGLHALRSVLQAGQRSLATLFVLPLLVLGLGMLGLDVRDRVVGQLAQLPPLERVDAWISILGRAWIALACVSAALRLVAAFADRRPTVLSVLPIPRSVLAAAVALPWLLLSAAVLASVSGLLADAMGPTVGFYGGREWLAAAAIAAHFAGAVGVGVAAASVVDVASSRVARARSAPLAARAVLVFGLGAALAFAARAGLTEVPGSDWMRRGMWSLYSAQSPWEWIARLATLPATAALVIVACARLAPAEGSFRYGGSARPSLAWHPPRTTWRALAALDLRLLRREPAGLVAALAAQLVWIGSLLFILGTPMVSQAGEKGLRLTFENIALVLPAFWGSFAMLSPALELHGSGQIFASPTPLLERTWGKLCAAFAFGFVNWLVAAIALAAAFGRTEPLEAVGRSIAIIALAVAASYLAGLLLPVDLRTGFSGVSSLYTMALALAFLALPVVAIGFATQPLRDSLASRPAEIVLALAAVVGWLSVIQRTYLRHGFRID